MAAYVLAIVAVFVSITAQAGPLMAYMMEKNAEKQIMLSRADGSGAVPVTDGARWHLYPALDAAGKRLAWIEGNDERDLQVVVKDLATGTTTTWTARPGRHLHPRFSGDGRYLAVSAPYGTKGVAQIALFPMEKGPVSTPEIIESGVPCYFPAPSSDGAFIVFQRTRGPGHKDIVLYRRDTKKLTALTDADGESMAPALSFDDRYVAYTAKVHGNWDVYVLDRVSGERMRVTTSPAPDFAPRFRPDGSLVYASEKDGHMQLFSIDAEEMRAHTFRPAPLVVGPADYYAPTVSGDVTVEQRRLSTMPEPARSSFGSVRVGDRIYISGGHAGHEHTYPPESFLAKLEYFDLGDGRWHEAEPRPMAAHGYGIVAHTALKQGKEHHYLYAFGGFTYSKEHLPRWKSLDSVDRYDIDENRWETVARLRAPRSSNVVGKIGNKVYLIAGWDSTPKAPKDTEGKFLRTIEVFDLDTQKVELSTDVLPDPLRRALSSVVVGDEIVLIGGLGQGSSHFELLDKVTAYEPSTGRWRELPRLPFATFAPAAGNLGRELFVFGGMFETGKMDYDYVSHVFSLRPGASAWEHTGRYLAGHKGFSMVVPLGPHELGILGGHSYDGGTDAPVRAFETYAKSKKNPAATN